MKKIIINMLLLLSLMMNVNVYAEGSEMTQDIAIAILYQIQADVNNGNTDNIILNISPNAKVEIKEGILWNIMGKKIEFDQELKNFEKIWDGIYKINAIYVAKWLNWNVSGLSNFYIMEFTDGRWFILDTDFFQFMPAIFSMLWPILPILMLLWFVFFVWMLNDCLKREIENKWMWVLLMIFVPFGSLIYFFTGRKKFPLQEKYKNKLNNVKNWSFLAMKTVMFWILFFIALFIIAAINIEKGL